MRARRELGLGPRIFATQLLVIIAGSVTLIVMALSIAPGVFQAHVERSLGPVGSQVRTHLNEAFVSAVVTSLAVAVAAATLTALTVSWLVTRRLTRSVAGFAAAAGRVASGDYRSHVQARALGSEFTSLADAFNRMADVLAATERTRQRLLADLAHELRTPLATISSYVDGLADGVVALDSDSVATLSLQARRLSRLVGDLAAVSQADEGQLRLRRAWSPRPHWYGPRSPRPALDMRPRAYGCGSRRPPT